MDWDNDQRPPPPRQGLLADLLTRLSNGGAAVASKVYPLVTWTAKVGSFLTVALLLASAIYLIIYYTLIGEEVVTRRLYFTFDTSCKLTPPPSAAAAASDEAAAATYSACTFPLANASLDASRDEPGGLVYGQAYRVSVHLWLPDNRANRLAGMFLVRLQMYSRGYSLGAGALRPALLPHRPWSARLLGDLATAAFGFLTGWDAEPRQLRVDMIDDYVENPFAMSAGVLVELHSRRLQVQQASVEFRARLSGLKYLMYAHPVLSACLGVPAIAWLLLLASAPVLLRRWLSGGGDGDADGIANDDDWLNEDEGGGDADDGDRRHRQRPHPMPLLDPTRAEAAAAAGDGEGGGGEVRQRHGDGGACE